MEDNKELENQETNEETGGQEGNEESKDQEQAPTVEELMAQLAQERAEKERYKVASNKASSDAATYKKQLRAKLTAEEQEEEAKREQEEQHKKYVTGLEKELSTNKATKRYMGLGMDEALASETATAEIEGDAEKVTENMRKHMESVVKQKESEWVQSRPDVNAGHEEDREEKDPFLAGFES